MSTVYDEKLLDKVGLAMVPSGYTNNAADEGNANGALGKVYSVLPIQTTSDNLVTNGDFSDGNTNWQEGTGWTIANGVATSTGTAGFTYLTQSPVNTGHKEGKGILTLTISGCTNFAQAGIVIEATPGGSGIARNFNTLRDPGATLENGVITFTKFSNYRPHLQFWNNTGSPLSIDNISYQIITDGDFDFSRGSDATRVNSQGYIESVQVLSDELVQNGDFEEVGSELSYNPTCDDSIAYGNAGSGYSDEDGTDQVYFYNGGIKTERLRTGNLRLRLAKSNGVSSGLIESNKIYKVTFDVIEANFNGSGSANIQFYFDGTGDFASISETPASYEFYVKSSNVGNGIAQWSLSDQNIGYYVVYDNVSVKEVGQNWTFGTGWSITDDGGNLKVICDGTQTSFSDFRQNDVTVSSKIYKISLDIEAISGVVELKGNGVYQRLDLLGVGTHTVYITADATYIRLTAFSGATITIDNVSVVEITDDTDIPRLDYTNQACPSLLLEPQRSNLITYSEDLNSITGISKIGSSIDTNVTTSPEGLLNASLLKEDSSNGSHFFYKDFNLTNGSTYTITMFVKSNGENRNFRFGDGGVGWSSGFNSHFDLTNGTATDGTIENYGNGWYRCSVTGTTNATTSRLIVYPTLNTATSYQGDGSSGVYLYGFQIEEGSYPTSYIPTHGSTVTRLADVCNNAGDSTIFNDAEGVLFVESAALVDDLTNVSNRRITISDGTADNRILFAYDQISQTVQAYVASGGALAFNIETISPLDVTEYSKFAIKYKSGDYAFWINGQEVYSGTGSSTPIGLNTLRFEDSNGAADFFGNTRQLLYFNEALSDAELEYITSADIDLTIHNYKGSLSKISATYEDVGVKDRLTKLF